MTFPRVSLDQLLGARASGHGASLKRGVNIAESFGVCLVQTCEEVSRGGRRFMVLARVKASWTASKRYAVVVFLRDNGALETSWCECLYGTTPLCAHAVAVLWALYRSEPGPCLGSSEPRAPWQSALQYFEPWLRVRSEVMYAPKCADNAAGSTSVIDYLKDRRTQRAKLRALSPEWRVTAALYRQLGVAPTHLRHPVRFHPVPLLPNEVAVVVSNINKGAAERARKLSERNEPEPQKLRSQSKRRRKEPQPQKLPPQSKRRRK